MKPGPVRLPAFPISWVFLPLGLGVLLLASVQAGGSAPETVSPPGAKQEGGSAGSAGLTPDTLRFEGEFGLAVHLDEDSIHARWVTRDPEPGYLRAEAEEEVVHEASTPPDSFHVGGFERPGVAALDLTYGWEEKEERRHETRIHLDFDERGRPPVEIEGVDTLFAVADIHGEYDNMIEVFRNAGLIDEDGHWSGGTSHLAVLGDMMGRGMDVTPVLWFLYRLEREAEEAGGAVHIVLGNHEFMTMMDDLRYAQGKELLLAQGHGIGYHRLFDPRYSLLGRWLTSKPAAIRINDLLMAHGGVSGDYLDYTLESLQDSLAAWVEEDLFYDWDDPREQALTKREAFERRADFFWGERSVLWYRGYARSDTLDHELRDVLDHYDSNVHVVGHTPVETIREGYDGDLILVNTFPFADQVLRLVRTEEGYERLRIPRDGEPLPLDTGLAPAVEDPEGH